LIRTGTYFAKPIIADYIPHATTEGEKKTTTLIIIAKNFPNV
jgi:hypothetical protein